MSAPGQTISIDDAFGYAARLLQAGQIAAAEEILHRIVAVQPGNTQALHLLAVCLAQRGALEAAVPYFRAVLARNPTNGACLNNLGNALQALRRHGEAADCYEKAIAVSPDNAAFHVNRGNCLKELARFEEALASYGQALARNPAHVNAYFNRATVLHERGRFAEALADFDRALALEPGHTGALRNRGITRFELQRYDDALADFEQALARNPRDGRAHVNRGNVLAELRRYDEAVASYERALALEPDSIEALFNRANALRDLGRFAEAVEDYERAITLEPDDADAHWNEALARLAAGDLEAGWRGYEWRWKTAAKRPYARSFAEPQWTGAEDLRGRTVLLHAEQGFGDAIQFCRYVPLVADRGARVVLEAPAALVPLFRSLAGVDALIERGQPLPDFDFQCALPSLPLAFGTTLDTIPAPGAYLAADAQALAPWREWVAEFRSLRVGIAWSGSLSQRNDRRPIPLATLLDALPPGLTVVGLQKDVPPSDRPVLAASPRIADASARLHDFGDTAALVAQLDLVISVDTAVAHLAGALGRPIWLLASQAADWRWLTARTDSPWYPSMRIFRQPAFGDWRSVAAAVRMALEDEVARAAAS